MYHYNEHSLQDMGSSQEPSQGHSAALARLTIGDERDGSATTAMLQPEPLRHAAITTDLHELPHPRRPTTTHPTPNLQHRESNIRSSSLPTRSSTPRSASTPSLRQSTTTATYFTGALTAASQMNSNTDRLLVAYNQRASTLGSNASEVDLRHPPQSFGSPPASTHASPPYLGPEGSTLSRYEARGGNSRLSPFHTSSSSDLVSAASLDDDEMSAEKSSPEPTASTSATTTETNAWDKYVENLGASKFRCSYPAPKGTVVTEPCCGQLGDKRHLIIRHIKAVHLNIRPFKCSHCDRCFPSNSGLETHINTHTGETPYRCPFCERGFADRAGLHRHKVKEHDYQPKSRRAQTVFVPQ